MYYAVRKGYTIGVFDDWEEAKVATSGFSDPDLKKFETRKEAEAYLDNRDVWGEQIVEDNRNGYLVAFTDGSYDKDLNRYSYGVELILPDGTEESICGYGSNKEYLHSNNIIGEIFGVINAFDWAISNGYEKMKIYHDYEGLSKWITGEWSAKANVSKMFVSLYKNKFKDFIQVEFVKVPGHSNVIYNEKADQLARTALNDRKKVTIKGEHWFTVSCFNKNDFDAFSELIEDVDKNIVCTVDNKTDKVIYRFRLNKDTVTVSLFKSGQHKLLVQGKNSYLFQVITTTLVELDENIKVEQIIGNAYRMSIKKDVIDNAFCPIDDGLPSAYPPGIKRLIKQAVINLNYYVESEDFSQYAFPALKALEGHIRYLIKIAGGEVGKKFTCFRYDRTVTPNRYVVKEVFKDSSKNIYIENCYNYYVSQRHSLFHFGDVFSETIDGTRSIDKKEEADEIIKRCIDLITTQR